MRGAVKVSGILNAAVFQYWLLRVCETMIASACGCAPVAQLDRASAF